jgi:hypothetical protein
VKALIEHADKPMYAKCSEQVRQAAREIERSNWTEVACLFLTIRERVFADVDFDAKQWTQLMLDCAASRLKDKLYGLWGVSMNMKGIELPYDDPNRALHLVHLHYPQAAFVYPEQYLDQVDYKTDPLLDVEQGLATVHELTMRRFQVECLDEYKRRSEPLLVDHTIDKGKWGLAWGGNDVKLRLVADSRSIGFAYDDPPESTDNRTLRIVYSLGFWQAYRDHKDRMPGGDPLANPIERAFYRDAWREEHTGEAHSVWARNRAFWGLGDDDWRCKFHLLDRLLGPVRQEDSPLQPHLDAIRATHNRIGHNKPTSAP